MSTAAKAGSESRPAHVYVVLIVGVVSIASSAILVKYAQEGAPLAVATWRLILAVLLLLPFAIRRVPSELRILSRREHGLMVVSGIALGFHFAAWIESLYLTSVASSTVLVTTSPVFLAILGFVLLGEQVRARVVVAIGISLLGSLLIATGDSFSSDVAAGSNPTLGNALALAAAMLVSVYFLVGRAIRRRVSWISYVFPVYLVASATTFGIAVLRGIPLFGYSTTFYVLCLLMALIPQIIGHGAFNYAIKYVPAVILGILTLSEPIVASIAAYYLFGEVPIWIAIVGMILVLAGVALATVRRQVYRPSAAPERTNL